MKEFLEIEFFSNTIETWLIVLSIIFGTLTFGKLLAKLVKNIFAKRAEKTKIKLDDILVKNLKDPIILLLMMIGNWIAADVLTMSDDITHMINNSLKFAIILNIIWLITRVCNSLIEEYIIPLTHKTESDLDDHLIPIVKKTINSILWIIGFIMALDTIGYDAGALIAGLGIGGIALAMAAKDSISNIFGGFTIFTDKPFKMGDRIRVGGYDGTIVEIGLRSSRLKTLDGTLVTIPNSKMTDSMVENVTREPARKIVVNLGLTYNTSPKQYELE